MDLVVAGKTEHTWLAGRQLPEAAKEMRQLHAFKVRENWPASVGITRKRGRERTAENFALEFPGLQAVEGNTADTTPRETRKWQGHIWDIRELLLNFNANEWATNFSLQAMLRVICKDVPWVAAMDEFILIPKESYNQDWTNGSGPGSDPRLGPEDELVNANLPGYTSTERFRRLMYDHRFIATFINFEEHHWIATLLDQCTSVLYLYDTCESGRKKRMVMAGLAWRSFALNLGMPCRVRVMSVPLREQPNAWMCGYLGLINLIQSVRSLVGRPYEQMAQGRDELCIAIDGRNPEALLGTMALRDMLPTPDWGYGATNARVALSRVGTVLHAMMFNQLGIRTFDQFRPRVPLGKWRIPHDDFSFESRGAGGLSYSLAIPDAVNWPAEMRPSQIFVLNPTQGSDEANERYRNWRPYDDVLLANSAPGASVSDLAIFNVRCWNRESEYFKEEDLAGPSNAGSGETISLD